MSGASFSIRKGLAAGGPFVFPWLGMPGAVQAAFYARMGFPAIAIDLQHGTVDNGEAAKMVAAINATGKPAIIRTLWNDPGLIGFALDMGAAAVIVPMVNSVEQAKSAVKSAKYPPLGQRSWGGYNMLLAAGVSAGEYLKTANEQLMLFVMIETQEALDLVDEIAAVKGLDGLFVGPSDLSIALSKGAKLDRLAPDTIAAMKKVAAACKKNNIVAGAFAGTHDGVKAYTELGFNFLAGPTDGDGIRVSSEGFLKGI
jgi:4-hydroxy-2-oxoheptanedioate aldolase